MITERVERLRSGRAWYRYIGKLSAGCTPITDERMRDLEVPPRWLTELVSQKAARALFDEHLEYAEVNFSMAKCILFSVNVFSIFFVSVLE